MKILAVDPGLRGCGCALFAGETLELAAYVKNTLKTGRRLDNAMAMALAVERWAALDGMVDLDAVVVEVPRSYSAGQQKGPQDDLIDLAMVSAAVAAVVRQDCILPERCQVVTYYPYEWKGSVAADTFTERILERLSNEEKQRIERIGELDHNTIDSVGIGLKFLGRMERSRKYARD